MTWILKSSIVHNGACKMFVTVMESYFVYGHTMDVHSVYVTYLIIFGEWTKKEERNDSFQRGFS